MAFEIFIHQHPRMMTKAPKPLDSPPYAKFTETPLSTIENQIRNIGKDTRVADPIQTLRKFFILFINQ